MSNCLAERLAKHDFADLLVAKSPFDLCGSYANRFITMGYVSVRYWPGTRQAQELRA
jgi:hypothetical protein